MKRLCTDLLQATTQAGGVSAPRTSPSFSQLCLVGSIWRSIEKDVLTSSALPSFAVTQPEVACPAPFWINTWPRRCSSTGKAEKVTLHACCMPAAAQNIQGVRGGPLHPQRQSEPSPVVTGSSSVAHWAQAASWRHPALPGQDPALKATLGGVFCCHFSKQEPHAHIPSWTLVADFRLARKQAITSGGNERPVTEVGQSPQGQLYARAALCLDAIPSERLPAC